MKKILIAENERIIALDLKNTLVESKYQVIDIIFNSSLIQSYISRQKPDLIITGVKKNPNVFSLIRNIIEEHKIPVLVISGVPDQELADLKTLKGCSILRKPFEKETLLKAVEGSINKDQVPS